MSAAFVEIALHIRAVKVLHHHIRCSVGVKTVLNLDNSVIPRKTSEGSRLINKLLFSVFKITVGIRERHNRSVARHSLSNIRRIVFFYRDPLTENLVKTDICNSEPALTQRNSDNIPVVQHVSGLYKRRRSTAEVVFIKSAMRTNHVFAFVGHTTHT